ncbi:Protein IQ-domain 1 [Apostasia shenzhenica]|uniref:Protein IQ-domain 1 n=1 Tax=Apostasia shenzhenica TaxID=1088818 RepID=A0A2I0B4F3_9ASPA|nr:Protein IQ-domain 1 [Apostasia shenzhenica]
MGKRGKKWFGAFKKVFSPESKEKKVEKSKKWGFGKSKESNPRSETLLSSASSVAPPHPEPVHPVLHPEEVKLAEAEHEQSKQVYSVAIASAAAAEAAVAAAQAAAEVVRLTTSSKFAGKSREEVAAIKIQTAFRGYLARRALRALRGLVRLKSLIHGNAVRRQATTTLRCMQTLARVQSQIRSRRMRVLEENQALQRQLLLKRERELETMTTNEEWDDSIQSKEQIEASLLSKQEAAVRRERALAYAFSHQWKNSSRSSNPTFMDPNNPHWGWSWLERWMAARPWESRNTPIDKELNSDNASVRSTINVGGITRSFARRDSTLDGTVPTTPLHSARPPSHQSPRTSPYKLIRGTDKIRSASPKTGCHPSDDDSRSVMSMQFERPRRHSRAGSSVRDDESLASSPAIPSYMTPTESARAKNRFMSSFGDLNKVESFSPDKGSAAPVKKRLSFPPSPAAMRRHSGPPRMDHPVAVKPKLNGINGEAASRDLVI